MQGGGYFSAFTRASGAPCFDVDFAFDHRELTRLVETPLSDARLKAARKQLLGQLAIASDNGEAQCLSMGKSLLTFGRLFSFTEDKAAIEAITAADIQKMSLRLFGEGTLSTLVYY